MKLNNYEGDDTVVVMEKSPPYVTWSKWRNMGAFSLGKEIMCKSPIMKSCPLVLISWVSELSQRSTQMCQIRIIEANFMPFQCLVEFWVCFMWGTKELSVCNCLFSCDQAALQMVFSVCLSVCPSVCLSVCPSVTPFWLCSHHRIIMKFSGVITNDQSKVHAKGQDQRSKVKVTEVTTQLNRFRTVTPVWIHIWWWNDAYSLMLLRRGALLFCKVIRQISRSHGSKNCRIWPRLGVSWL